MLLGFNGEEFGNKDGMETYGLELEGEDGDDLKNTNEMKTNDVLEDLTCPII